MKEQRWFGSAIGEKCIYACLKNRDFIVEMLINLMIRSRYISPINLRFLRDKFYVIFVRIIYYWWFFRGKQSLLPSPSLPTPFAALISCFSGIFSTVEQIKNTLLKVFWWGIWCPVQIPAALLRLLRIMIKLEKISKFQGFPDFIT